MARAGAFRFRRRVFAVLIVVFFFVAAWSIFAQWALDGIAERRDGGIELVAIPRTSATLRVHMAKRPKAKATVAPSAIIIEENIFMPPPTNLPTGVKGTTARPTTIHPTKTDTMVLTARPTMIHPTKTDTMVLNARTTTIHPTRTDTMVLTARPTRIHPTRTDTMVLTARPTTTPTTTTKTNPARPPSAAVRKPKIGINKCRETSKDAKLHVDDARLRLWLKADGGITLNQPSKSIHSWSSAPRSTAAATFSLSTRRLRGSKSGASTPPHVVSTPCGLPSVEFGCSLASAGAFMPREGGSIFLVASPAARTEQKNRLLGRFPNGGVVFASDGQPAFTFSGKVNALPKSHLDMATLANDELVLIKIAYTKTSLSIGMNDGELFTVLSDHTMDITTGGIYIGGTNGGCEYKGLISEVLVYSTVLDVRSQNLVSTYLVDKWGLRKEGRRIEGPLACVEESISHYGEASDVFVWHPSNEFLFSRRGNGHELVSWSAELLKEKTALKNLQRTKNANAMRAPIEAAQKRLTLLRSKLFGPPCKVFLPPQQNRAHEHEERMEAARPPSRSKPLPKNSMRGASKKRGPILQIRCKRPHSNNILNWQPPAHAPYASKIKWRESLSDAKNEVAAFQYGGKRLATFLTEVSDRMNGLRDELFGDVCADDSGSGGGKRESGGKRIGIDCNQPGRSAYDWKPPPHPRIDANMKEEWNNQVLHAKQEIATFDRGGKALQKFLHDIVTKLELKRDEIFGDACGHGWT